MMALLLFGQLALSESLAVDLALRQNPLVDIAEAQVALAREDVKQARGTLLPRISFNGQYRYTNFEVTIPMRIPVGIDPTTGRLIYREEAINFSYRDNYNLTLQVQQVLFGFGKSLYGIWMMDKLARAQEVQSLAEKARIRIQVRRLYQGVLLAREYVTLAQEVLQLQERHLEDARERFQAGLIPEAELIRAEIEADNARIQLDQARSALDEALAGLRTFLNLPETTRIVLTDSLQPYPRPSSLDSLHRLLADRPDLKALRYRIQAMEDQRKLHRARFLPTVAGFAFATYQRPYGIEDRWGDQEGYGIQITWDLFNGGRTLSDMRKAAIQRDILRKTLRFQEIQARNQLTTAFQRVQRAWETLKTHRSLVDRARSMMELTRQAYTSGLLREVEFQDAVMAFRRTRTGYLSAVAQYNRALLDLEALLLAGERTREEGER